VVGKDTVPVDAERGDDLADVLFVERAVAHHRRGGEGQDALDAADADQADGALLHDTAPGAVRRRLSSHARVDPRVGCPANGSSPPGVKIRSR
jgi:hypothetical protein